MAKETGLLLKGPLVLKTLRGIKTETRRVIRPDWSRCLDLDDPDDRAQAIARNPYGHAGDLLYVRETWKHDFINNYRGYTAVGISYRAGESGINMDLTDRGQRDMAIKGMKHGSAWRPGIHMPKVYSRLWLKIREVAVQRLQDIPFYDIRAEGFDCPEHDMPGGFCVSWCASLRKAFQESWDKINGARGFTWEVNPHVFVVRYSVADCMGDD